jgi:hypothetical protein
MFYRYSDGRIEELYLDTIKYAITGTGVRVALCPIFLEGPFSNVFKFKEKQKSFEKSYCKGFQS